MHKLIILLFATALLFGCSEEAEEVMDEVGEVAEDAMDNAGEVADDAMETAGEIADGVTNGPEVEPLPDWDSLPPIEEEVAAEEGSTMMEKAEEKAEEIVEKTKDKAEEMIKQE